MVGLGSAIGQVSFAVGAAVAGPRVGRLVGQVPAKPDVVGVQPVVGSGASVGAAVGFGVGSVPFAVGAAVAGARVGRPVGQMHAQAGVVDVQPVVGFGVGPDGSAVGHSAGPSSDSSVADRVKIDSVVVCHVFPAVRAGVRHAVDGAKV